MSLTPDQAHAEICELFARNVPDEYYPKPGNVDNIHRGLTEILARLSEPEHTAMLLAAISVAAMQNTRLSAKERIGQDNQYWTPAYGDVCAAIDREIELRERLEKAVGALRGVSSLLQRSLRHGLLRAESEAMLRDIAALNTV